MDLQLAVLVELLCHYQQVVADIVAAVGSMVYLAFCWSVEEPLGALMIRLIQKGVHMDKHLRRGILPVKVS